MMPDVVFRIQASDHRLHRLFMFRQRYSTILQGDWGNVLHAANWEGNMSGGNVQVEISDPLHGYTHRKPA